MTTKPNFFMKSLSALRALFRRHKVEQPPRLLPRRNPLQAFRPGRQHFEIHDADYLQQILRAELESQVQRTSASPEEGGR
jgi:hypothetical protein